MARSPKLKVFRTAIGFHDAFVAAPSQKAALEAWGARSNLFTRGVAEIVTDPKLAAAALAAPGKVIKVLRGTPAEQIAALGKGQKSAGAKPAKLQRTAKPSPRPSRAALDRAEKALAAIEARHRHETDAIEREEAALRKRQAALRQKQDREYGAGENKRDAARENYDRAMEEWRDA